MIHMGRSRVVLLAVLTGALVLRDAVAQADCTAPAACCITSVANVTAPLPERVRIGVRFLRVDHVSERDGNFAADVYLITAYPAGGLRPDLDIRNAGETPNIVDDRTLLQDGVCYRSRRVLDTFDTWYRLRRFPFDEQLLRIVLDDDDHTDREIVYDGTLWPQMITDEAYRELTSWRVAGYPMLHQRVTPWSFAPGGARIRHLTIELPVTRVWEFYLTRYFLPLLLIVALAFTLFWTKPEDLGSASSIGMTCVLAIIAFQLTQADTLPHVPYLTLADRIYVVCYVATAAALGIAVRASYIASAGRHDEAHQLHHRSRRWFPAVFVVSALVAIVSGWRTQRDPRSDTPETLAAPTPPPGSASW